MTSQTTTALSFQPWSRTHGEQRALKDILARVSGERGHFRDITEASLQEEIAMEGALELSESESEREDEDEGAHAQTTKAKPTSREELFKAKHEMLAHVRAAEQEILMSLDFVSLLLSKDAPRQAQNTISPVLKQSVPLGSLGVDLWQRQPADVAREAQDELLATNVRIQGLQKSADSLLGAATLLQENVRKETRYWDQILSISDAGWNVCRIPGEQHQLGVRYGFSESASEFSRRGLAALGSNADGAIVLERGIGARPKALLVLLRKGGEIVGASQSPRVLPTEELTLEARIRHARDSLFDEELYHEMIRESRLLASLGVRVAGTAITFGLGPDEESDLQVSFDLVALHENDVSHHLDQGEDKSHKSGALAQAGVFAARLLLCEAHREKLRRRSVIPPPMSAKSREEHLVMQILRPMMSVLTHRSGLDKLNAYVSRLGHILDAAQIRHKCELASFSLNKDIIIGDSRSLIVALMSPWASAARLSFFDPNDNETALDFTVETSLIHGFGSQYTVKAPKQADPYTLDDLDDFASAADEAIAAGLAGALSQVLGEAWECRENDTLVVRELGTMGKSQSLTVGVDSVKQMLSLHAAARTRSWVVNESSDDKGFWHAANDMLES